MTEEQELFWNEIQKIQDYAVNISLSKEEKYDDVEALLNDVTYETIYRLMELLDGYWSNDLRGEIVNKHTGSIVNLNTDLHNYCEEYLKCSSI